MTTPEDREQFAALLRRVGDLERQARGQGWVNAATWCAHLYLTQEPKAVAAIKRLRRRSDGGIHPRKLERLYRALVAQGVCQPVDDWCFEPVYTPTAEDLSLAAKCCGTEHLLHSIRPRIMWQEIATYLEEEL